MINKLLPDDVKEGLYFLLDFVWVGRTIHLSTDNIDVVVDGNTIPYNSGLEWGGSFEETIEFISADAETKSVPVTLHLTDILDVPTLIAQGHLLGSATGTLYIYSPRTEKRLVLVDGKFVNPTWDVDLPVSGSLREFPLKDDTGLYPPQTHRITPDTWSTFVSDDSESNNEFYPTIIGAPSVTGEASGATPAYYIGQINPAIPTRRYGMIAGHPVEATTVDAINMTTGVVVTGITLFEALDDNNITCTFMELVGFGSLLAGDYSESDDFRVNWNGGGGFEGIYGAGDLLEFLLRRSSIRIDQGRISAIKDRANQFQIDTYLAPNPDSTGIVPMEYIHDSIIPMLPVSAHSSPNGWYLAWWAYEATLADAVFTIEEGRNATRNGVVESTSRDDVTNEVRVNYNFDSGTGKSYGSFTILGDPNRAAEFDSDVISSSLYARNSFDRYGFTKAQVVNAEIVTDASTASAIANWRINREANQRFIVAYDLSTEDAISLGIGEIIRLIDTGRGFTERVGLVAGKTWSADGFMTIQLDIPAIDFGQVS